MMSNERPVASATVTEPELSLRDYLQIVRRGRWIAVPVFVAVVGTTIVISLLAEPSYESTSSVLLRTQTNQQLFPTTGASQGATFVRDPIAELDYVSSTAFTRLAEAVAPAADVTPNYDTDSASVINRSGQLEFVARAGDPHDAQAAAQLWAETYLQARDAAVAEGMATTIDDLEAQIADLEQEKAEILAPLSPIDNALLAETDSELIARLTTQRLALQQSLDDDLLPVRFQLRTLSEDLSRLRISSGLAMREGISARISTEAPLGQRVGPDLGRNVALALVVGGILALGAAILKETIRTVIRSATDVEAAYPTIPVLAELPELPTKNLSPMELAGYTGHPYSEALERIVSAVQFDVAAYSGPRTFLITSPASGDGKSTLAAHLAVKLAGNRLRTILVDADLRRPNLHVLFGTDEDSIGLNELLRAEAPLGPHVVRFTGEENMLFLPAGNATNDAAPLLRRSLGPALDGLPQDHDALVVDAPPVLAAADAEVIASSIDSVLVVVRAGRTTRGQLEKALARLQASEARIFGFVLVGLKKDALEESYYGYEQPRVPRRSTASRQYRSSRRQRSHRIARR